MKKIFLILLALLAMMSCKKDSEPKQAEVSIVGNWSTSNIVYNYYSSTGSLVFTNTVTSKSSWSFSANTISYSGMDGSEQATYSLLSNNKILIGPNSKITDIYTFNILALESNMMAWFAEETGNFDYQQNGTTKYAPKLSIKIVFSR